MKRYYIIYQGRVQGVGFRWRLMNIARKYNFTGYCRNLANGDVECEIQGKGIDEFVKDSLKKDFYIDIYNYSIKDIPIVENEKEFKVLY